MGWFSPLKGAYPGLQQIDKTLSVDKDAVGIVRGSVVWVDASDSTQGPVFKLAGDTQATDPTAYVYFTLVGQEDFQAGMAGTIGQGPAGGVARITALAVGMPMEFQTDQYDHSENGFAIGSLLTAGAGENANGDTVDGLLCLQETGENVVAQMTAVPRERWVNDAVAVPGRRTGAMLEVIAARTMWIPTLTVA